MSIKEAFRGIIDRLIEILPASPFAPALANFENLPFLGYLNWFIPVRGILLVMTAWLAAITLFYMYSVIMRWVKLIGD